MSSSVILRGLFPSFNNEVRVNREVRFNTMARVIKPTAIEREPQKNTITNLWSVLFVLTALGCLSYDLAPLPVYIIQWGSALGEQQVENRFKAYLD